MLFTFLAALALLVGGYFIYGTFVEKVFGIDEKRATPACANPDGVDYVPLSWWRVFLIQFLNIAGLGPIFGAIAGALWGPVALLWIVFGSIFAGAVHDFFSGMISLRHNGSSVSEIVGIYLGNNAKQLMRVFSVILLVLVGTVFMTGPARLLVTLTDGAVPLNTWLIAIVLYYFLATILPIDQLIAKIYPLFGAVLLIMAIGIGGGILFSGLPVPELTLANLHPRNLPIWPLVFITIACGAISGFHATQSPMMARCLTNEKHGRRVFYGSMIAEGAVALIWATAAMTFYGGSTGLDAALAQGAAGRVVHEISMTWLGAIGGVLAVLGVIVCPITSGDTAFRSARLTIADALGFKQLDIKNRLIVAIPLFAIGIYLSQIDFAIIWRYFAWSNQTLAMIMLWAAAVYLKVNGKLHWVATVPATFMAAVTFTYILQAPEGLRLATSISYPVGLAGAALCLGVFLFYKHVPIMPPTSKKAAQ
ncbi:MAG: carbon starvation protein A [Dethiobacter sp.]|nr:carbon starvation protein A [Dethiobacter sp.]MBS4055414.1 carbon starvation protein A [Thermaerobacter sp.]